MLLAIFMKNITPLQENHNKLELKIKEAINWHKTRVFMVVVLVTAIISERSVSLRKLAKHINPNYERDTNYRRVTRFFQFFEFNRVLFAKLLSIFLPKNKKWTLIMDRTNWKFGKVHINFLVLSVKHKGIAIPLLYNVFGLLLTSL